MNIRQALLGAGLILVLQSTPARSATLYVDLNSGNPIAPYADWSTAAQTIQAAVDASTNGDLILVTNGVYQLGTHTEFNYSLQNRLFINKTVTVQSVNGPQATIIQGTNSTLAVRCVYMNSNAVLSGFTLNQGTTLRSGDSLHDLSGGGALVCIHQLLDL